MRIATEVRIKSIANEYLNSITWEQDLSSIFESLDSQAIEPPGSLVIEENRRLPKVLPGQVLVKTVAVALNPCDWKMPTNFPHPGAGDGSDYAGIVVELGPGVVRKDLRIGDRVAGAVHASNPLNPESGSFAQYVAGYADHLWKIPDTMSMEDAAAIGWCTVGSVGMALHALKLPGSPEKPVQKPVYVLVYGGSTASGTMAIQLLKLSGFKVITTCSPKNFALVESYGAEKAFDYRLSSCAKDIRAYTNNSVRFVLDIITVAKSIKLCYAAIGRTGGQYIGFELIPEELIANMRKVVKADWVLGIRLTGEDIALPGGYGSKADPELRIWGSKFAARIESLIHAKKIRPHPPKVYPGGLDGIISGVERMKRGEISGEKMVYLIGSC
ncbi:hypothetical protein LOZ53_001182 [Ophidiomyces ophidiicola]|nr:hypothetical protein LOZ61_000212 [Ophidiomyces ophidiicola]KAI1928920.1 hypothetical protein LOZ60_002029 [Ophidiomyces ophidiicola]KAI1956293.1 hypothetical protein LOZ59_004328 [Ophidiomyces ophidiicola]KAI1982266.1 hypothetical protein LOZ55_000042 [Ophidiomyces ophidiicola]KAI1994712.1 hypothetical protein LOZ54_000947 [Ophidiomyces ophidiicola]